MVERYVHGRELTCAVMGDVALGVCEIIPTGHSFYDYDSKYVPGGSKHVCPAKISPNIYQKIQTLALKAHQAIGCRGVSRSDFRYDDRHSENGELDLAGSQHPAGHDADVAGARDRRACGAFVRRSVELDGGGRFVFALRSGQGGKAGAARPALLRLSVSADRFVLPRWLAPAGAPARRASATATSSRRALPRRSPPAALALARACLYGACLGGHMPAVVAGASPRALGFAVDEVRVSGNHETSEIDILERLDLDGWTSLIGFDADAARAAHRRAALGQGRLRCARSIPTRSRSASRSASPSRSGSMAASLPSSSASGSVIAPFAGGRHAVLPLVIGYGAAEQAAGFVDKIRQLSRTRRRG